MKLTDERYGSVIPCEEDVVALPPPGGFRPEDFPRLEARWCGYISGVGLRPDPAISIADGLVHIGLGNVLISATEENWRKLHRMVDLLFNAHACQSNPQEESIDLDRSNVQPDEKVDSGGSLL